MKKLYFLTIFLILPLQSKSFNKVDFSSPKASFNTFYNAMSDYSKGIKIDNKDLKLRIKDALEVLQPSLNKSTNYTISYLEDKAILLKEIIDRTNQFSNPIFENNRLKGTNIFFVKINNWYYISNYSLERAQIDYNSLSLKPYLKNIPFPGASHKLTWLELNLPKGNLIKIFEVTQIQWIMIFLAIISAFALYYISIWLLNILKIFFFRKKTLRFKVTTALIQPISIFISAFFLKAVGVQIALNGNAKFIWISLTKVLVSIGCFWLLYCLITPVEEALKKITAKTESDLDDSLVPLISKTSKIIIIVLAALTIIEGLGVNVFSLLAGLGVGGLAIALAAKDTAANFFGSLMILFDQPFKVGDWIKINDLEGTVEEIGFRSTRVRTFYDSQIVIPNSKVANNDIDNLGRRQYRRTVETLGLTYSTSEEQLKEFTKGLRAIIDSSPLTRKDKYYISFKKFGDSSLEILLYFFLKVSDYKDELQAKEQILLQIKHLAETLNVDFAFPSQSIYMEKSNP